MFKVEQYYKRTGKLISSEYFDFLADAIQHCHFVRDILRTRKAYLYHLETKKTTIECFASDE